MWQCHDCGRTFDKQGQVHSCHFVPLSEHFAGKAHSEKIFTSLLNSINDTIGGNKAISLPCCIHLYGTYEYLAALPKATGLK